ncbi:MAG: gamma carbonic anhydrase family protein [Firmicutes bacterium]|nr:gamma carbonic anhydrase family protein [Bacillota bacterium]
MNRLSYLDKTPLISKTAKIFEQVVVVGDVVIHDFVSIWYHATIRGDMAPIEIKEYTNIQDNAVIHTNTNLPTFIGKYVTVGHGAIIHGATVLDYALIGMGSIILDGAVIGEYSMVGAGALIPPGKIIPPKMLVIGNPMRIVRELTVDEIKANLENAEYYVSLMKQYE